MLKLNYIKLIKNNQNIIIRRTIDIHNKSSYRINNKSANATKVKEITQRLNIQVNNLTVFLAQDRVSSFARMSPYELLLETEKAANPQLAEIHLELINEQKEYNEHHKTLLTKKKELEVVNQRVENLSLQMTQFHQYQEIKDKIQLLKLKQPWAEYFELANKRNEMKVELDKKSDDVIQLENLLQPDQKMIIELEEQINTFDAGDQENKTKLSNFDSKRLKSIKNYQKIYKKYILYIEQLETINDDYNDNIIKLNELNDKKRNGYLTKDGGLQKLEK